MDTSSNKQNLVEGSTVKMFNNSQIIYDESSKKISKPESEKFTRPFSAYATAKPTKTRPMTANKSTLRNAEFAKLLQTEAETKPQHHYKNQSYLNISEGTTTKVDLATRPSTGGNTMSLKIKRSASLKKEKDFENIQRGIDSTLKRFTSSAEKARDVPIQMYYKSIEPYFKKKKHVSGYQAEIRNNEDLSSSKESSDKSNSVSDSDSLTPGSSDKKRVRTKDNWFKEGDKSFSRISEEDTDSAKNSYGLRIQPKRVIKQTAMYKQRDPNITSLISSFF